MKESIFISIFLLLFSTGSIVDAKWIPPNATPEDVERLVKMEEEDKARIISEQHLREKTEQEKKQIAGVTPGGIIDGEKEAGREISSQAPSTDKPGWIQEREASQIPPTDKSVGIQQQAVQGVPGVSTNEQTIPTADKESVKSTEAKKMQKTGWKDWVAIAFFILIFISSLVLYLYAMNISGCKTTGQKQATKNTASKGLTLVEILVATVVIVVSVLCVLKAFRYASLVQPQTGYSTKAMTLCEEKLEEIRNRPYGNLTAMIVPEQERINMGIYGWVGTSTIPRNGGATRTTTIKRINEVWHGEELPPTFEEVPVGATFTYLKAKVKMEWGSIPIRDTSGTITGSIPLKRELSVFIAPRT
ncbi:MAG: hypothetical protein QME49_06020 [bacterium]|nr:hypothetical protein [bacterium]